MTRESSRWVAVGRISEVDRLLGDAMAALARHRKSIPGDRVEAARFEAIATRLERIAHRQLQSGAPATAPTIVTWDGPAKPWLIDSAAALDQVGLGPEELGQIARWLAAGAVAVELRQPLASGPTIRPTLAGGPPPPMAMWEAAEGSSGREAIRQRFRSQLEDVVAGVDGASIVPSGVSNSVLTECLREFAAAAPGRPSLDGRVVYRDGSRGPDFPLGQTPFRAGARPDRVLRFALLSIRHAEMDAEVDGAWLRNTTVSRPRPAGDTDQLVFETSLAQLRRLTTGGPQTIYMHQTGLETAVLGFYRAVARTLMDGTDGLSVVPCYFRIRRDGSHHFVEGTPWTA